MTDPMTEATAREMRKLWFDYLDTMASSRPKLHRFCMHLTGSVWDAEDLVQDTLLKGFGQIGRCDMSPPPDPGGAPRRWFAKPHAYLAQIATNLWIDRRRRAAREVLVPEVDASIEGLSNPVVTKSTGARLFAHTSPQERAAVVLSDVFDFTLEEIAEMLSTTVGTVKSALHRGRLKLDEPGQMPHRNKPASEETLDRFIAAWNERNIDRIKSVLLESVTYEPQGVGGERGLGDTIWLSVTVPRGVVAERHAIDGESIVAYTFVVKEKKYLGGIQRLEESDDARVSRIINYYFCPETIAHVARGLSFEPWSNGYHQDDETLMRMIANAGLPWTPQH